jgi:cleavage and polyadenylation specificity factor subunit 4
MKHVSAFGHVGSPLRNSSLASAITAGLNGVSIGGMVGNNDDGNESVSALTRQLRETRLAEGGPETLSPHLHPTASRNLKSTGPAAATAGVIGKERERERGFERHISSGSISSSMTGRFTTPIDEEDSSFVFRMEEEDDSQMRARKRASGGNMGVGSPLSTGWSYANVAAAERAAVSSANANKGNTGGGPEAVGGR